MVKKWPKALNLLAIAPTLLDKVGRTLYLSCTMKIGSYLADLRKKRGWSQKQLIEELERIGERVSRSAIANSEANQLPPSNNLLRALERVYGLPRNDLFMFGALMHAEGYCERFGVEIDEYLEMVKKAMNRR